MCADPVRLEEARAWLARAEADLRAAQVDLDATPPLIEDAAFHCQQASEKSLKSFLAWHDRPFRKTHNLEELGLEELGEQSLDIDESLRPAIDPVVPLTEFAWRYRYPGEAEELPRNEVEQALEAARILFDAVLTRVPSQARPAPPG